MLVHYVIVHEFCLIQQTLASAPIIVQSTFSKDYNARSSVRVIVVS